MHMTTLEGQFVSLEPLMETHREELRLTAQDENTWTYFPYSASGEKFDPWFTKSLRKMDEGEEYAFAVRYKKSGVIVGSTRYYEIALKHRRLKIGHTWYTQETRGTAVNPESKLLLLTNAFEKLNINRVEFTADSRNTISRAAMKKLGATEEGILRQHLILENGFIRDSVVLSILKEEWPLVKTKLRERLNVC